MVVVRKKIKLRKRPLSLWKFIPWAPKRWEASGKLRQSFQVKSSTKYEQFRRNPSIVNLPQWDKRLSSSKIEKIKNPLKNWRCNKRKITSPAKNDVHPMVIQATHSGLWKVIQNLPTQVIGSPRKTTVFKKL